jgi:hypothetical protein
MRLAQANWNSWPNVVFALAETVQHSQEPGRYENESRLGESGAACRYLDAEFVSFACFLGLAFPYPQDALAERRSKALLV